MVYATNASSSRRRTLYLPLAIIVVLLVTVPSRVPAKEKKLSKNGVDYVCEDVYGDTCLRCNGERISIGEGTVRDTTDSCSTPPAGGGESHAKPASRPQPHAGGSGREEPGELQGRDGAPPDRPSSSKTPTVGSPLPETPSPRHSPTH